MAQGSIMAMLASSYWAGAVLTALLYLIFILYNVSTIIAPFYR